MINGKYFDKLQSCYSLKGPSDTTLLFESRFESGNLAKVVQVAEFEYDLELKPDHGASTLLTQWYFFKVSNTRRNLQYKFNIVNLIKPDSLYNNGMRPLMYSKKTAELKGIGWVRCGNDIRYYQSKKKATP
jgi:cytosolic carboxypeptidase protein 2/3